MIIFIIKAYKYQALKIVREIIKNRDFNILNNRLNDFNIDCFEHRVFKRLDNFFHITLNSSSSPNGLEKI